MSKIIDEIKIRSSKIKDLMGDGSFPLVDSLAEDSHENEWVDAWNTDQGIIMDMINNVELLCGRIELSGGNNVNTETIQEWARHVRFLKNGRYGSMGQHGYISDENK